MSQNVTDWLEPWHALQQRATDYKGVASLDDGGPSPDKSTENRKEIRFSKKGANVYQRPLRSAPIEGQYPQISFLSQAEKIVYFGVDLWIACINWVLGPRADGQLKVGEGVRAAAKERRS